MDICWVYPNPANNILNIISSIDGEFNLLFYDFAGNIVFSKENIGSDFYQTDVSQFSKGMYIVSLNTSESVVYKKITIQ